MKGHTFQKEILKACDIRGIVGQQLYPLDAFYAGQAFGTVLVRMGLKSCVTGFDGRHSSTVLVREVIRGLVLSGIRVTDIGLVPTPAVYFAVMKLEADAGLMVTASHNPAEYNGFKMLTKSGPFHGSQIQDLARIAERGDFERGEGRLETVDIVSVYMSYLEGFISRPVRKSLSIVWDPGNGAVASLLSRFLARLPGCHDVICGEVDGDFPHHHPDPSQPSNMRMLQNRVRETGADLGIAFDGDGDRLGAVDGEGEIVTGDQLLVLFARDHLERHPGSVIMSEVKASRFFYDDVKERGGVPLMWKVGHTNQKEKMKTDSISFAGETSGHVFFSENNGFDDALFASVKLLNILSAHTGTLSDIRASFPVFHDSGEIRIALNEERRIRVLDDIEKRLTEAGRPFFSLDGLRVEYGDGFWMIRGSNTQPHLTLRCEAASRKGLDECLGDLWNQLKLSQVSRSDVVRM